MPLAVDLLLRPPESRVLAEEAAAVRNAGQKPGVVQRLLSLIGLCRRKADL